MSQVAWADDLFEAGVGLYDGDEPGQATLGLPAGAGVCLFADRDNRPVLLIQAGHLRDVARRRLLEPQDDQLSKRARLRPVTKQIFFRETYSRFETELAYFQIAKAVFPDNYKELLPNFEVWFVHLDEGTDYPALRRVNELGKEGRYWGPLAEKTAANRILETLEDVYGLCRCNDILATAPNGERCTYAQMNRCAIVCDGTMNADDYQILVNEATRVLDGAAEKITANLTERMRECSKNLEFEQAQKLKDKIKSLEKMSGPAYRWLAGLDDFYVLGFQAGPRVKFKGQRKLEQLVRPFVITPGGIVQVADFRLTEAVDAAAGLLNHVNLMRMQREPHGRLGSDERELLGWIVRYLYRRQEEGGLFVRVREELNADELKKKVSDTFSGE